MKNSVMTKFEKIATALLVVIAVEGAVTAYEMREIARNGFEIELSDADVEVIEGAMEAAFEDMNEEGER